MEAPSDNAESDLQQLEQQLVDQIKSSDSFGKQSDKTLTTINELHEKLGSNDNTEKSSIPRQQSKQYQKLLTLYRTALESSEKELEALRQANEVIGRLVELRDAGKSQESSFWFESTGASKKMRRSAVLGALEAPLPKWPADQPPGPLVGCFPVAPNYIIPVGAQVAARTPGVTTEGEEVWILATIVRYITSRREYEVEDIMEEEDPAIGDLAPGRIRHYLLAAHHVYPLPTHEPPEGAGAHLFYSPGTPVLALFPQTTCFYPGTVVSPPNKKRNTYIVEFKDDADTDGTVPRRNVSQRYVIAAPPTVHR